MIRTRASAPRLIWTSRSAHSTAAIDRADRPMCDRRHIAALDGRLGSNPSIAPEPPTSTRSERKERVMSSISRTQQSDAGVAHAAECASAHGQDTPRQDLDAEDRRWQLEWARRNVED